MPELPEVETMVRGIRSHTEGQRINAFVACSCACRPLSIEPSVRQIDKLVTGETITAVTRRAKRVILRLSSGWAFVIEPRMTGLMLVSDPPDLEHLRVVWKLGTSRRERSLWFWDRRGLGTIRLFNPDQLEQLMGTEILGPDALIASVEHWTSTCQATARAIKVLMLDQKKIAGIGNLYASEILHRAKVDPQTPAQQLRPAQIERIATSTIEILETAIQYEGSTLSDGTYRNALNQAGSYQNAHKVYDREDEVCPTCQKSQIIRIVQAQRSTFYCPACQKAR